MGIGQQTELRATAQTPPFPPEKEQPNNCGCPNTTPSAWPVSPNGLLLSFTLFASAVAWALIIFLVPDARFVIYAPAAKAGVEVILGFTSLFAALVLRLFPDEGARVRLRWVSAGFVVLGIGELFFGYLEPLISDVSNPNYSMYGALVVRTLATALFAVGLMTKRELRLSRNGTMLIVFGVLAVVTSIHFWQPVLPRLANVSGLEIAARTDPTYLHGLTPWHWILSLIPLLFAGCAAVGAARHYPGRGFGGWLLIATTLLAGSQLHNLFWPSAYSPIFTTSSMIRLAFTAVVLAGAVTELRRIAAERQASLAANQEIARRLTELAVMKADFTAMVVHEVSSPLAAIRALSRMLTAGDLDHQQTGETAEAINSEAVALEALFRDVQMAATVERDDFSLQLRPVSVSSLLAEAERFSQTLTGDHPVHVETDEDLPVLADTDRIGQVLRNLLSNAAKFSNSGTPIEVRSVLAGERVRIVVVDHGFGIHADDIARIFEKFGRGRDVDGQRKSGVGLGLYLSQRIVRGHGSEISVESKQGVGSTFSFELRRAQ